MTWSINWDAVAAIGQWAGAIATFWAVMVALKQVRDASTVRVIVKALPGFISEGPYASENLVFISATNAGQRPVKLTSAGILLPDGNQLMHPGKYGEVLPVTLQEAEEITYHVSARQLAVGLIDRGYSGRIDLKFYFEDTRGVRHYRMWRQFDIESCLKTAPS